MLFVAGIVVGSVMGGVGMRVFFHSQIRNNGIGQPVGVLRPNMSMSEVEQSFGKPDRVEIVDGQFDGKYEHPKQIIWTYERYRTTDSDESYGAPGHIRFIPLRFTHQDWEKDDDTAKSYGEQSDSFRVCSFKGSFPIRKQDWPSTDFGLFDGVPLKERRK